MVVQSELNKQLDYTKGGEIQAIVPSPTVVGLFCLDYLGKSQFVIRLTLYCGPHVPAW